ncbi:MAG: hypothetical protein JO202_13695 [Ktedonobacteraceae bacterium]|nr:hypothetical protein [Ktedonobacteraceae bacterium]
MVIVLCTVLAIALAITAAGVFLSYPRFHVSNRRNVYAQGMHSRSVDTCYPYNRTRKQDPHFVLKQGMWGYMLESLDVSRLLKPYSAGQTPWLGLLLVLFCLFMCGLYVLRTVLPTSALLVAAPWNSPNQSADSTSDANAQLFSGISGASRALVPISQVDPAQYASIGEYNTWWPAACSAGAMTAVIDAYGHHYRLTDILSVELRLREITVSEGLLEPLGIDRTVTQFGFKTTWLNKPSLDDVITIANSGRPIIISFPPSRWAGGHILVVIGGNKDNVLLADSSRLNMRSMARNIFVKYWVGFAVVVTPR